MTRLLKTTSYHHVLPAWIFNPKENSIIATKKTSASRKRLLDFRNLSCPTICFTLSRQLSLISSRYLTVSLDYRQSSTSVICLLIQSRQIIATLIAFLPPSLPRRPLHARRHAPCSALLYRWNANC